MSARTSRLRPREQIAERTLELAVGFGLETEPCRLGERVTQRLVAGALVDHALQVAKEGAAGIGRAEQVMRFLGELLDPLQDDDLEERFLAGEMPLDGARADADAARDLVERHAEPFGREDLFGRFEHACPVAAGVGTQRRFRDGHRVLPISCLLVSCSTRSLTCAFLTMVQVMGNAAADWEEHARKWITWTRAPGLDSYWRYRDDFLQLVPAPGKSTLDLGCGEGRLSRDLTETGHQVTGIDVSATLIDSAREAHPEGEYLLADATDLPFEDESFDIVIAYNALMDWTSTTWLARSAKPHACSRRTASS